MAENDLELVIPDVDGIGSRWTSGNAWGVAVQHDADGPVTLTIGTGAPANPALALLHEGVLRSSRRLIEVQTVYLDSVITFRTGTEDAAISIWGDHPDQAECVHIQCQDIEEML
ncbi:hypothetical protein [Arthrobacter sp. AD-310]